VRVELSHSTRLEVGEGEFREGGQQVRKHRGRLDDMSELTPDRRLCRALQLIVRWSRNEMLLLA
jgi:hypothetical protein